jgi:hypothetical protein
MDNRELLELAAKAYYGNDVEIERYDEHNNYLVVYAITSGTRFAPLTDDGDALRLAVKLGMEVYVDVHPEGCACTEAWSVGERDRPLGRVIVDHGSDPYAATRRAIVRAAAEVGKEQA